VEARGRRFGSGSSDEVTKIMSDTTLDALIIDLLEWLTTHERTYQEVIEAWRTSCPRLPVWEDARDRGFVTTDNSIGREVVRLTATGLAFLRDHRSP
jgi:hypothetical protein